MTGYQEPKGRRRGAIPGSKGRTRDVRRPWKIGKANSKTRPHLLRWVVAGEVIVTTFATRPLADGFRSRLMHATDMGEEFDIATGLPVSMLPTKTEKDWLSFCVAYMAARWDGVAPKTRDSIADSLATTALAMAGKGQSAGRSRVAAGFHLGSSADQRRCGTP